MKVESFTQAILQKMTGINKSQNDFFQHLIRLILSIGGRLNFMNMGRYGSYCEQSYRLWFSKPFDFAEFNKVVINQFCSSNLAWIFDPSFISKSGKKTAGVGYFWSGCAGSIKWGLEIMGLAIGDIDNHTAMHYRTQLSQPFKGKLGEESLRTHYANFITQQAEQMLALSKLLIVDAFFSKKPFIDMVLKSGFTVISRLQHNAHLRYAYKGQKKEGRGRPKTFDGKIDIKNVSTEHFEILSQDENEIIYHGRANVRCLKHWCKVVIVNVLKDGKVTKAFVYFSTDCNMEATSVLELYRLRFQIEFLFRDTKGHLGLQHCQSRKSDALNFHFNAVLTTLNVVKAKYWLSKPKQERGPFSIADIKTQYTNEFMLDKLIKYYGKDPQIEKNNPTIRDIYNLGRLAS